MYCFECDCDIDKAVFNYSINKLGWPLCRNHQEWFKRLDRKTTDQAILLYFLLKQDGVPAELEKSDGHKKIDIVIEDAKVHIEVDGGHHNYDSKQALADLKRTYYSFKDGYFTLRIPNSLMCNERVARETANFITDLLILNRDRNKPKAKILSIFKLFQ
jgi:very-short-patch-repair endonuclease